ncbi:MAG: hypothetical protein Q4F31_10465, partial [Eubacteriales bacterium]|nr:hypothetical protein [Eubacteriales bacterium]
MKAKIFLMAVLSCVLLVGCGTANAEESTAGTYSVTVQGAIFGGNTDDRIPVEVTFDPKWVTEEDNTRYNSDLAQFAAIVSDDVYFRSKDLEKGTQNRVLYEGENEKDY